MQESEVRIPVCVDRERLERGWEGQVERNSMDADGESECLKMGEPFNESISTELYERLIDDNRIDAYQRWPRSGGDKQAGRARASARRHVANNASKVRMSPECVHERMPVVLGRQEATVEEGDGDGLCGDQKGKL